MSIVRVAQLAGVSSATVSRVINNHPRVARSTVDAVRAAMRTLQYTPSENRPGPKPSNRQAPRRTATIAFLVLGAQSDRATPAFEELMRGVSNGVAEHGLKLVYHHVTDFAALPPQVADGAVDGLLLHGTLPPPPARERLEKIPTVWLMGNRRRPDFGDQVMPDTYETGTSAARYLTLRGHTKLAYLNLDRMHGPFRHASQSFATAARHARATCELIETERGDEQTYWPQFAIEAAEGVVRRLVALKDRPTGLYIADDMQTAILQPALQQAGVAIGPGQVEIISTNNESPYSNGLVPRPAEIDIRVQAIGRRGVERLLWRLDNPDEPERIVTAVEPYVIGHDGECFHFPLDD